MAVTAPLAAAGTSAVVVSATTNSDLGKILVTAAGRTLYSEKGRCTGTCAVKWPPLLASGRAKPVAGPGVTPSLLGVVKRPDGRLQIAYHGLLLYRYSGDARAGDVNGQGVGGVWHAVAPSGALVTKTMGATPTGSSGSDQMSGSGTTTTPGGANPGMWCAANPSQCENGVPKTQ